MTYINTRCTKCGNLDYHNLKLYCIEQIRFDGKTDIHSYKIRDIEVTDTVSQEEFAESVLHELADHVYNGITTKELCRILERQFGVMARYCCDVIQRLKIELDMYCPDHNHLYYVEQPA